MMPLDSDNLGFDQGFAPIPGMCNFRVLYQEAVDAVKDGAVFVEMGVALGRSACMMAEMIAESGKRIEFYAVDLWDTSPDPTWTPLFAAHGFFAGFLKQITKNAPHLARHIRVLRIDSVRAARCFDDKSLDFVFIDGAHNYLAVKADLAAWAPKVKVGGVLAGHDYNLDGVKRAVHDIWPVVENVGTSWRVKVG
jgi:predicted O-methyltransferase YrrM